MSDDIEEVGDLVRLKSGGADMVVSDIKYTNGFRIVSCVWHDDLQAPQEVDYPDEVLVKVQSEE